MIYGRSDLQNNRKQKKKNKYSSNLFEKKLTIAGNVITIIKYARNIGRTNDVGNVMIQTFVDVL